MELLNSVLNSYKQGQNDHSRGQLAAICYYCGKPGHFVK